MKIAITHSTTACVLLEIGSIKILTDPVFDVGRQLYRLGPAAFAQMVLTLETRSVSKGEKHLNQTNSLADAAGYFCKVSTIGHSPRGMPDPQLIPGRFRRWMLRC